MKIKNQKFKINYNPLNPPLLRGNSGIALVAVLAILTVLAILAAAFTVSMKMESSATKSLIASNQQDLLLSSASEHAKCLLSLDINDFDHHGEGWARLLSQNNNNVRSSLWFSVKSQTGKLIGRYRILVEDESGKINLNVATLQTGKDKNLPYRQKGVGTFRIALNKTENSGTKLSLNSAKKLLKWRYGPNFVPGKRNFDDNDNSLFVRRDGIDNNGNGQIDEPREGIDDQSEYLPEKPRGDDKSFTSMSEVIGLLSLKPQTGKLFRKRATVCSYEGQPLLSEKKDANCNSPRTILRALRDSNAKHNFSSKMSDMRKIACNIIDNVDENHVLTTLSGNYGIESICFNEILAHDGTIIAPVQANVDSSEIAKILEKRVPRASSPFTHFYTSFYVSKDRDNPALLPYRRNKTYRNNYSVMNKAKFLSSPNGSTAKIRFEEKDFKDNGYKKSRKELLKSYKKASGDKWPRDLFKGAFIDFIYDNEGTYLNNDSRFPGIERKHMWIGGARFEIVGSGPNIGEFEIKTVGYDTLPLGNSLSYEYDPDHYKKKEFERKLEDFTNASCNLVAWQYSGVNGDYTKNPEVSDYWIFPDNLPENFELKGNTYYSIYLYDRSDYFNKPQTSAFDERDFQEKFVQCFKTEKDKTGKRIHVPIMDTDGNYKSSSTEYGKRRRIKYNKGNPLRSDGENRIGITLTSSDLCTAKGGEERVSRLYSVMFQRPEVVELMNISDKPVAMKNWTLVANSGSLNVDIGKINSVLQNTRNSKKIINENPVIDPGGYFYIVNNEKLFDYDFGSPKNGSWGRSGSEKMPLFEIDEDTLWGIHYRISKVGGTSDKDGLRANSYIDVEGGGWDRNQLAGEYIEIVKKDKLPFPGDEQLHNADGIRLLITGNSRKRLYFDGVYLPKPPSGYFGPNVDGEMGEYVTTKDEFYVCGLPKSGGFVSLTLKNEYNQICARTADYGDIRAGQSGTKRTGWSVEKVDPAGSSWKAVSQPSFGGTLSKAKNRSQPPHTKSQMIIRNRPMRSPGEILDIHGSGDWEVLGNSGEIGKSQRLIKGVDEAISLNHIMLQAESSTAHKKGWIVAGGKVKFSKYNSVITEKSNWRKGTWKNHTLSFINGPLSGTQFSIKDNEKNMLKVVTHGTPNGAILKPNQGDLFQLGPPYSSLMFYTEKDAEHGEWSWQVPLLLFGDKFNLSLHGLNDSIKTSEFLEENHNAKLDVFLWNYKLKKFEIIAKRIQYGKNDVAEAGKIKKDNISETGEIRMQIVPHDLQDPDCSGKAWFDYATISPRPAFGKININTAQPEVLIALQGMNKKLAKNIARGIDKSGHKTLYPYNSISDLLKVKGMTHEAYYLISPQVTVLSASFSGTAFAEVINDSDSDGIFRKNSNDSIETKKEQIFIFDRKRKNESRIWDVEVNQE